MIGHVAHGDRYYRCATKTDNAPGQRCSGVVHADVAEGQVWEAVMRLLNHPERIRHEVERQHAQVDGQQEIIRAEREALQRAFDALALRVTFRPRAPLHIEARIPVVSESDASSCGVMSRRLI